MENMVFLGEYPKAYGGIFGEQTARVLSKGYPHVPFEKSDHKHHHKHHLFLGLLLPSPTPPKVYMPTMDDGVSLINVGTIWFNMWPF